jgi:hypothetical protein
MLTKASKYMYTVTGCYRATSVMYSQSSTTALPLKASC